MAKKAAQIKPSRLSRNFSRILVLSVLVLCFLIALKSNTHLKEYIYKNVFQNNMSFAKINEIYKKHFGSSLPLIDNITDETTLVSVTKLEYSDAKKYKDGAELTVKNSYLVPSLDSGLVIFSGEKENYGNTIIIQRPDNIEVWYCNIKSASVDLYDYIKKGEIIGEVNGEKMYMVFTKEGETLDYKKYL